MDNLDDNEKNNDIEEIEIVIGDDTNLEFSKVTDFASDLKPQKGSKKHVVIPKTKKEKDSNKSKK